MKKAIAIPFSSRASNYFVSLKVGNNVTSEGNSQNQYSKISCAQHFDIGVEGYARDMSVLKSKYVEELQNYVVTQVSLERIPKDGCLYLNIRG